MKANSLPRGWIECQIADLVSAEGVFRDGDWVESKDQDPNGDVRLIQLADIGDGNFTNKSSRFLTSGKAKELNCTFLEKGDVLIARMPDPLGRSCIFPLIGENKYVTVVDVCVLRTGNDYFDLKFLMFLINSPFIRERISALQSGSTRKRISRKNLATISFPIAPLNEQKRIVAKIEELFSELDNGIAALKTAREQLKVYRQAVLKHAFEGKLTAKWREENADKLETPEQLLARIQKEREERYQQQLNDWKAAVTDWEANGKEGKKPSKPKVPELPIFENSKFEIPSSWATTSLGSVAEVSGGLTKNQKRNTFPLKMKYLRVANVYADKLLLDDVQEIGVTEAEATKVSLAPDDLLVVEGNGSVDQIGRVALWDASISSCGHQNHLIRVRFDNPNYARFILLFLLSPIGRDLIVKEASSTSGLHTLSISKVSNLQIPIVSLPESAEVMKIVDEKLTLTSKFEYEIEAELQRAETLRQSILKKAFSGQLVPQDPNDESASALLARIKAEQEAEQSKKAKKKPTAKRGRKSKPKESA